MDILYSFRRCPYAMRARMALLVSGLPFVVREVSLRDKPAAMMAASPKGTVPVLVAADGHVVDQSIDIMRRALRRRDPEDWLTGDDAALIDTFDDRFKYHLDRYKYADRYGVDPVDHREAGIAMLRGLDSRLSGRANLWRETRSLTDIAIIPFVRQFAAVDPAWFDTAPVPHVRRWLGEHLASTLFAHAMIRLSPWRPGDPDTVWPI